MDITDLEARVKELNQFCSSEFSLMHSDAPRLYWLSSPREGIVVPLPDTEDMGFNGMWYYLRGRLDQAKWEAVKRGDE